MANLSAYTKRSKSLWVFRFVQFLFSFITLIVAGNEAQNWVSATAGCKVPSPLGWNIAVAVLTWPMLAYLFFSSGVKPWSSKLPWSIIAQVVLDALFWFFWLIATSTSHYTCSELCSACSAFDPYEVWGWGITCTCSSSSSRRSIVPPALAQRSTSVASSNSAKLMLAVWKIVIKIGLDTTMLLLFTVSLIWTSTILHHARIAHTLQSDPRTATDPAADTSAIEQLAFQPKTPHQSYPYPHPHQHPDPDAADAALMGTTPLQSPGMDESGGGGGGGGGNIAPFGPQGQYHGAPAAWRSGGYQQLQDPAPPAPTGAHLEPLRHVPVGGGGGGAAHGFVGAYAPDERGGVQVYQSPPLSPPQQLYAEYGLHEQRGQPTYLRRDEEF